MFARIDIWHIASFQPKSYFIIIEIKFMLKILKFIMNLIFEKIFKNIDKFHLFISEKYKIQMCIGLKFQAYKKTN